jgi:hypothetical protein
VNGCTSRGPEEGAATLLPLLLWVLVLLAAVVLEVGAHLVARAQAGALADAAALAAVSNGHAPVEEAARVAAAGGGRLEACRCPPDTGHAEVEVSVAVRGRPSAALGAVRSHATSAAVLTHPGGDHAMAAVPSRAHPSPAGVVEAGRSRLGRA